MLVILLNTYCYIHYNVNQISFLCSLISNLLLNYYIFRWWIGEYVALKTFFATNDIQNLQTTPHTPQHNGFVEKCHCHVAEIILKLLHDASLSLSIYPYAFQTISCLIKGLLTPLFNHKSPYERLFQSLPNCTNEGPLGVYAFLS